MSTTILFLMRHFAFTDGQLGLLPTPYMFNYFFLFVSLSGGVRNWMEIYTQWLQHTRAPYSHSTLLVFTFELLGLSLLYTILAFSCVLRFAQYHETSCDDVHDTVRRC